MTSGVDLKQFSVGPMDNNVYILTDQATGEAVLFDAPTEAERIIEALQGVNVRYILMTHTDRDHVEALEDVKAATGAPVAVHPLDADRLPIPADMELADGQTVQVGNTEIAVLHTPGHTPGSVSFLTGDILIAGDTLFPGGPGATGRREGDFDEIIESVRTKLLTLPDETLVYPGHGKGTTIGAERPHLQEWIDRGY